MKTSYSILLVCLALSASTQPITEEILYPPKFINIAGADLVTLLPTYSELVGRNLLRSPAAEGALKASVSYMNETPLTRSEAIRTFEAIYATNGVRFIEFGDKFLKVVRAKDAATASPPPARVTPAAAEEIIFPRRSIIHNGTELGLLLKMYSSLIGRDVSPAPNFGNLLRAPVFFVNQTPLTKSEVVQAYQEIFAMNEIGFVEAGNEGVRAVPAREVNASPSGTPQSPTPTKK